MFITPFLLVASVGEWLQVWGSGCKCGGVVGPNPNPNPNLGISLASFCGLHWMVYNAGHFKGSF